MMYGEHRFQNLNFTGYTGLDHEQFNTFNMGALQDRNVLVDLNTVYYLTIGFSRSIEIFNASFFTKLSLSKSLQTKTDVHSRGTPESEGYDGYKILWYLNKKISDSFFIHSLFKYHWMDGPSELKTLRVGIGFGYILL